MVDWQSPEEIESDESTFKNLLHVLLGIYIWEWFTSMGFDWAYISRKRPFRWPLIFYFLNRYSLLFALSATPIALNVKKPVNCKALWTFLQVCGSSSMGFSPINLSLRTMAIYGQSLYVVIPLTVLILGHWSLILHGVMVDAVWQPSYGCVIKETNIKILASSFIYGMSLDFIVLMLMAWKLVLSSGYGLPRTSRSALITLIFSDGLIYFVAAFLSNLVAAIFVLLNLNPVMSVIGGGPAATVSTIVACRVVRRLAMFSENSQVENFLGMTFLSNIAFKSEATSPMQGHPDRVSVPTQGADVPATRINTRAMSNNDAVATVRFPNDLESGSGVR